MARTSVADALFGKTRQKVLGLLFGAPDRGFYLREIIAHVGGGSSQVQTELARLTAASLLVREKRANQVWYRANRDASVFPELQGIALKTVGIATPLAEALRPAAERIEAALIYGSSARGEDTARSDVDLLVVGKVSMADLSAGLDQVEARIRRAVSPVIMRPADFAARRARHDHFIEAVLAGPGVFVIGGRETLDDILRRPPANPRRKDRVAPR
jgi:predicted nucleotidyltransferase